jgi:hypothetical protein
VAQGPQGPQGPQGQKGSKGPQGDKGCDGRNGTKVKVICINYVGLSGHCVALQPYEYGTNQFFYEPENCQLYEFKNGRWTPIDPICDSYYYYDPIKYIIYRIDTCNCDRLSGNEGDIAIERQVALGISRQGGKAVRRIVAEDGDLLARGNVGRCSDSGEGHREGGDG